MNATIVLIGAIHDETYIRLQTTTYVYKTRASSFSRFCDGSRNFLPLTFSNPLLPRLFSCYLAAPKSLYQHPVYEAALKFVLTLAPYSFDVRYLYGSDEFWLSEFSVYCNSAQIVLGLCLEDKTLAAGQHAELAWAYQIGKPLGVLTWSPDTPDYDLYLHLSGSVETLKRGWSFQRTARFKPDLEISRVLRPSARKRKSRAVGKCFGATTGLALAGARQCVIQSMCGGYLWRPD